MNFQEFLKSKKFRNASIAAISVLGLMLSFAGGVFVGLEKARFSGNFTQSYLRNFAGPARFNSDHDFMNAHGSAGQIVKVEGSTITVKGRDGIEKNILTDDKTLIVRMREKIKIEELKANDFIVTIGSPNDQGQIIAKLIRVLPNPPLMPK